ncbi:MAG: vanadium-dependent haloperoxidase [Candidatus Entotheonellia bacterium]
MRTFTLGICACFLTFSLGWFPVVWADAVTDWNLNAGKAAIVACISPAADALHESRLYAMVHIAIHDALNAIDRRFLPYILDIPETSAASVEAAVATAARDVLVPLLEQLPADLFAACIPAAVAGVEADYTAALGAIADGTPKTQGIVIGRAAADAVLAQRVADGADTLFELDADYPQGTKPGEYRFTPPFLFAGAPEWGNVTPFVLNDSSQFRPGPPYDVTSKKYTADFNEIKSLGAKDGSTRTTEQTQIAHFWVESAPLQWNRIARTVSEAAGFDVWENARLFGLLNMALADGYIGSWETKYHYNYWRPVTAVQLADADGNPDTIADPAWEPLELTPPIPDYDSAHSVEGGAAAEVLQRVFETDQISFSTCSLSLPLPEEQCGGVNEVLRSYTSFSQAADENGVSRILVGFHFRKAVEEGIKHGRKIGKHAVGHFLKPVN